MGTFGAAKHPVCTTINNLLLMHFYYSGMISLCFIPLVKHVVYHMAGYICLILLLGVSIQLLWFFRCTVLHIIAFLFSKHTLKWFY